MVFQSGMLGSDLSLGRRLLLIQVHRAQIARLLGSRSRRSSSEVARRMNAIALLCDRGRTLRGQTLVQMLVRGGTPGIYFSQLDFSELDEPS